MENFDPSYSSRDGGPLYPNRENSVQGEHYPDHKRPSQKAVKNVLNYARAVSIRKTSSGEVIKNLLN